MAKFKTYSQQSKADYRRHKKATGKRKRAQMRAERTPYNERIDNDPSRSKEKTNAQGEHISVRLDRNVHGLRQCGGDR